jgi:hypothetical protein
MLEPDWDGVHADAVGLLEVLCREPSVSAEGRALRETARLVEGLLAGAGFDTRQLLVEGAPPAVYGEQRGRSDFTLLLYNHTTSSPPIRSSCGSRRRSNRLFATEGCSRAVQRTTRVSWRSVSP